MRDLVLSLFPGMDLLGLAFEREGFCVVTGPDSLFGRDVKSFHPPAGKFDGIIGGPPCKAFSRLRHIVAHNHKREPDKYHPAENLIPEFVRCVNEARPTWFFMENVPEVPSSEWPAPLGYYVTSLILNNRWIPDTTPQNRERRFWFGHQERTINLTPYIPIALFEPMEWEHAVTASSSGGGRAVPIRLNGGGKPKRLPKSGGRDSRSVEDYLRLQGLPEDFFREDTPFTVAGKKLMVGNGVPLPLGRVLAKAVREALS